MYVLMIGPYNYIYAHTYTLRGEILIHCRGIRRCFWMVGWLDGGGGGGGGGGGADLRVHSEGTGMEAAPIVIDCVQHN